MWGGTEPLIVKVTLGGNSSAYTVESVDHTVEEIWDAADNGIPCVAIVTMPPNYPGATQLQKIQMPTLNSYKMAGVAEFFAVIDDDSKAIIYRLIIWRNHTNDSIAVHNIAFSS